MEYVAIRNCYYSDGVFAHKYFHVGEKLPEGWKHDANGCTHFAPAAEAKKIIKSGSAEKRAMTAGDDKRSTEQLRTDLRKFMKVVPHTWRRKKVWSELMKRETAESKDAATNPKQEKK
ncbi:MAG: hypothetical protein DRH26_11750 [Deltaproteobacteria bacterium]|nr:MAG: hypothetical protein DRH26_11750 [Deltaproteobacteria bacterium]